MVCTDPREYYMETDRSYYYNTICNDKPLKVINKWGKPISYKDDKKFEFEFKQVTPGMVIFIKSEIGTSNLYFVVGRTSNKFYCLPVVNVNKNRKLRGNFVNIKKMVDDIVYMVKCDELVEIDCKCFEKTDYIVPNSNSRKVLNELSKHIVDETKIDYNSINDVTTYNSVVSINGNFYFVIKTDKHTCIICDLIEQEEGINSEFEVKIDEKKFSVDINNCREIEKHFIDYTLKYFSSNTYDLILRRKKINKYVFGDIISLNDTGEKVIFVCSSGKFIYACDLQSCEFFSGMKRLTLDNIYNKQESLSKEQKQMLLSKLKHALDLNRYIPENAKKEVSQLVLNKKKS